MSSNTLTRTDYISVSAPAVAPVASFSGTPTSGTFPLPVAFMDASTGGTPTMWNWSFGDNNWYNTTLSSERNPIHIYTTVGTYTAKLIVSNVNGGSLSEGRMITVTPPLPFITPTKIGVFRPSTHMFYMRSAAYPITPVSVINWGASTDLPVTGDWNADGITDVGVFRPSTHMFYLRNGTTTWATMAINWGAGTDLPVTVTWS